MLLCGVLVHGVLLVRGGLLLLVRGVLLLVVLVLGAAVPLRLRRLSPSFSAAMARTTP